MSDIDIIRGNNHPPMQWQFLSSTNPDVIFPLEGSVFFLTVAWTNDGDETRIALASNVDPELTLDLATSILAWSYSVEDSRSLPLGRATRYEIERWIGGMQQTLVRGSIGVTEGLNPDY